jgi:AAHS family 4-hydroxybenzoate transporter-like MFS transporter
MAEQWSIPPSDFGPALSAALVGLALGAVSLGPLADRYGRRPTLVAMMLIIGLTTLGAASASSTHVLMGWRVLTGLGIGGSVPIAIALVAEYAPTRRRAALVAFMIAFMAIGSFVAGLIAPPLSHYGGWQGIFVAGGIVPLGIALALFLALPESLKFLIARGADTRQIEDQIARIAPHAPRDFTRAEPTAAASAAATGASVGGLFGKAYRMRTILVWIIFWFNLFVAYSLLSWLPTLLGSAGLSHDASQRASGLLALGGLVGGLSIAWLADRGYATVALLAAYCGAALLLQGFSWQNGNVAVWSVLLFLVGAGAIGGQMAAGSFASAYFYPAAMRSTGVGWFNGVGRIGAVVGPLAVAALMHHGWTSAHIFAALAAPLLICAAGILLLPRAMRTTGTF